MLFCTATSISLAPREGQQGDQAVKEHGEMRIEVSVVATACQPNAVPNRKKLHQGSCGFDNTQIWHRVKDDCQPFAIVKFCSISEPDEPSTPV